MDPSSVHAALNPAPLAPAAATRESTDRLFFCAFAAVAALKLFLAAIVPFTGDEAYFVLWGRFPDYGYYDHGGMTGWWVRLTLLAGDSIFILRLPAVITPLLVALLLRHILSAVHPAKANLAATLFLLSPVVALNVLITPESPLLLFSFLAGVFAVRAVRRERVADWLLAGVFLGAAFLAKYLAVLLGLAFLIYLLSFGGRQRFASIAALLAGAAPGVAVNVIWNFHHGWTNVLFNVFTRNADARFSLLPPLQLAIFVLVVLAGPVIVYFLFRRPREGRRSWRETSMALHRSGMLVALFALVIPLSVFLGLSLFRRVGLHWLLSFFPFFFVVLAAKFDADALRRQVGPMIGYVAGCTALALVLLGLPSQTYHFHRSYNSLILGQHPAEVLAQLAPWAAEYVLVSPSYTQSAQLGFHSGRHVPVIGPGSYHGRHDDFITDFRALDGRNLMVLSARPRDAAATHAFFESVEARAIEVRGARIALVLGRGFRYAAYREAVLKRIAADYYRMPRWLEAWSRPAPFIVRYGLEPRAAMP